MLPAVWILFGLLSQSPEPDPVVALFEGGDVRASDVAREERYLARDERMYREAKGLGGERAQRDWARRIALRRIATRIAMTGGGLDAETRDAAHEAARDWWLGVWSAGCYGYGLEPITDEQLRAELAGQEIRLPPRLRLSHVFLRAATPDELSAATARLEQWRSQGLTLDQFQQLATDHSDSQSAHRKGRLGWLRQGWLPKEAEEVLFALAPGTISPPLALRGGVHLFYVEEKRPAEIAPLDNKLRKLRAEREMAQRAACRSRRLAAAEASVGESPSEDERLFRIALAQGALSEVERARLADLEGNVWLEKVMAREVEARLHEPTPEELDALYAAEPATFRAPRQIRGRFLKTRPAAGEDPLAFLDRLSAAATELGKVALQETLWQRFAGTFPGAETYVWPLQPAIEVAGLLGPFVFEQVKALPAGSISEPIQEGADFWVVAIEEDVPIRQLSREEANERLRTVARARRRQQLSGVISGELLGRAGFRFVTEGGDAAAH